MEQKPLDELLGDFFDSVGVTANVYAEIHDDIETVTVGRLWEMLEKMHQAYGMAWSAKALAERIGLTDKARLMSRHCLLLEGRIHRVRQELRIRRLL